MIWGKKKTNIAGNTGFEFGGKTSQSNGCAYDIMKHSVLQTAASMSMSLSNIFNWRLDVKSSLYSAKEK